MIEQQIQTDLMEAMKNHQEIEVTALRSVKAAIQVEKTTGSYHELSDGDVLNIIKKLVKQRKESFDIYYDAGRYELAEKEQKEGIVLAKYLPKVLSVSELETIIEGAILKLGVTSIKEMGKVMADLKERFSGEYDGKVASEIVRAKLG